jgi:sec-independent protein translocase protein TatA
MPNIGPLEIAIVLIIVLIIFGPKRLPELGRSMGRGIREFRSSIGGDKDKDEAEEKRRELEASQSASSPTGTSTSEAAGSSPGPPAGTRPGESESSTESVEGEVVTEKRP